MIPEAAVEAARVAVRSAAWGYLTPEDAAKEILEAAAPHMLAAAWDEGWFAAREFYVKAEAPEDGIESNPYRSKP